MSGSLKIETERLLLRSIELGDISRVFAYRSDAETNMYQGWIPKNTADVQDFINTKVSPEFNIPGTWHQLVIINKLDGEIIGDVGIHFLDDLNTQVEFGCTLAKQHQGKGYASEVLKELIDQMFNHYNKHRVIGSIDPRNIKSIALVERLGFRKEAHFKESIWFNNEWADDLVYAVLKHEWIDN